jgi:hypothetical protein
MGKEKGSRRQKAKPSGSFLVLIILDSLMISDTVLTFLTFLFLSLDDPLLSPAPHASPSVTDVSFSSSSIKYLNPSFGNFVLFTGLYNNSNATSQS